MSDFVGLSQGFIYLHHCTIHSDLFDDLTSDIHVILGEQQQYLLRDQLL